MTRRALVAVLLLFPLGFAHAASQWEIDAPGRVVAFGDVHGAYDDWVTLLQEVGVVDENFHWSGGNTHLVSLGDLIDRGAGSRDVVELMMKLDAQADAAGGALHMVLGNHEVMVMTGDLSYVSDAEFAAFAADESPADREAEFAAWLEHNADDFEGGAREAFDAKFPPGYFALRRAYAPEGDLGGWLLQQPFAIRVNDKVFMHGGIAYELAGESLEDINLRMRAELVGFLDNIAAVREAGVLHWHIDFEHHLRFLNAAAEQFIAENPDVRAEWFDPFLGLYEAREALIFSSSSPNWYRGSALCNPYAESFNTEHFLKRIGASQLVIGHTPSRGDAIERMDGLVLRLDTGMLKSVYNGRAAALVYGEGEEYIQYLGGEREVPVRVRRDLAVQLSERRDEELAEFMRSADIVPVEDGAENAESEDDPEGPIRVRQQDEEFANDALFATTDTHPGLETEKSYKKRSHDKSERAVYDVAAYRLDRMLDLQLVPTAVTATMDGTAGVLTDLVIDSISEQERVEREVYFAGYCPEADQYRLRDVFDILIHNEGRDLTNTLWSNDQFMLRLADHSRAFRSRTDRPKAYRKADLQVSDLLYKRLETLDEAALEAELAPYLHRAQIEAVLKRRDRILREAERSGR